MSYLFAQTITFNKTVIFTTDSTDERCSGVVEADGRYFIACTFPSSKGYHIGMAELDQNGNKISSAIVGDSINCYSGAWSNVLNKTSDGNLILTGSHYDCRDSVPVDEKIFLMKLTYELEIIWTKLIIDTLHPGETEFMGEYVIETSDNGFALIGQAGIKGVLYKTDSLGKQLWQRGFSGHRSLLYEYMSSIQELPDSGFLIGSYAFDGQQYQSGDPWVYRLTKTGQVIWQKDVGGPHPDERAIPILSDDSSVVVIAPYTTKAAWFGLQEEIRLRVMKLRLSDGMILADGMYGEPDNLYVPNQAFQMTDGTFRACGTDIYGRCAWLFGFTPEADSLFLRKYNYEPDAVSTFDTLREFKGGIACSDGGILLSGTYYLVYRASYRGNGWIVKTDPYGCFSIGCDTNAIYLLDQPDPVTICRDQTAVLPVIASGCAISYQWQVHEGSLWNDIEENQVYFGSDSSSLVIHTRGLEDSVYTYRVKIFNDFYQLFSDLAEVELFDSTSFIVQPQDQNIRRSDTARFYLLVAGEDPFSYQWYKDGELLEGRTSDSLVFFPVTESDTGLYYCLVTNTCGVKRSRDARLDINHTSIGIDHKKPEVYCYPNPFYDQIVLGIATPGKHSADIVVRGVSGKVNYSCQVTFVGSFRCELNGSGFEPGFYLLEINMEGHLFHRKILKLKK